nr:GNAT family N-acetyltransferase [uncultured Caproiciproducens sp.]
MSEIEIHPYRQEYIDEIVSGWNISLFYDAITRERFIQEVLLDENFDPELALTAVADGHVVGFSLGIKRKYPYLTRGLEEQRGWISSFFILPEYRRRGFGQKLLEEEQARLKARGVEEITLCAYSPNYFTPGVDLQYPGGVPFFDKNGYVRGTDAVSMQRNLFTYTLPQHTEKHIAELLEKRISFQSFSIQYMEKLLDFVGREFDSGWVRNILFALRNQEAENTILIATDREDNIIGYCMRKIDGHDARFGPIGVAEALRSEGLGGVLIDLQMMEMKKRGIYYLYFLWTHGDAMRFYERHGLKVYRTYQLYRKNI